MAGGGVRGAFMGFPCYIALEISEDLNPVDLSTHGIAREWRLNSP
jgi:hypothetical protein